MSGSKHVLLYPPDAKPNLYYESREDFQAYYRPSRGEFGRFRDGVSANTAGVNVANPDLKSYPLFNDARKVQTYAELNPSDCLYLPRMWHHHVFSVADGTTGYNLAINMWIDRETTLTTAGEQPSPQWKQGERFPTLGQIGRALRDAEGECKASERS